MSNDQNPVDIVSSGYDAIGNRYSEWGRTFRDDTRQRYTQVLLDHAARGMHLLDLGCGNGEPTTKLLSERYRITGVDVSPVQIALAARNIPKGQFTSHPNHLMRLVHSTRSFMSHGTNTLHSSSASHVGYGPTGCLWHV
jgi:ubiquinone/menaquinone biosynthesis C-methylase UbiE